MKKIWLVARNTYRSRVRSGSFLFLTFALPVLMIAVGVFSVMSIEGRAGQQAVGYVDETGQLAEVNSVETEDITLTLARFESAAEAQAAVAEGQVSAYLVIPAGYFEGQPVQFYGESDPGENLSLALEEFMRRALLPEASELVLERLDDPARITYVGLASGEEVSEGPGLVVRILVPAALAVLFGIAIMFTTNQMGSAVVREKEQRAMEMLITSLRPSELVAGKVLGMSLLFLTQFAIWALAGVIALVLAISGGVDLGTLSIPWSTVAWGLLLIVPGYLLFAMLGAGLGVIAGDSQNAQQLAGLFGMVGFVPIWMAGILLSDPDGLAAVALTLFPLTAPSVALLRLAFASVPTAQLAASLFLLWLSLVLSTLAVARVFRAAMLVYGQTLRPRQIWQALRQS